MQALLEQENLSAQETIDRLNKIKEEANEITRLPQPSALFMGNVYRCVRGDALSIESSVTADFIVGIKISQETFPPEHLSHEFDFNAVKNRNSFQMIMTQKFYGVRFSIAEGQRQLDAVRAQMGA